MINYFSKIFKFFAILIININIFFSSLLIFRLRANNNLNKFTKKTDKGKYIIYDLISYLTDSCGNLSRSIKISNLRSLRRRLRLIII
jgi:hypothetical protein